MYTIPCHFHWRPPFQVKRKHESAEEYFAELDQEQVRRLYEIYRMDFELFGYTTVGFLSQEENQISRMQ